MNDAVELGAVGADGGAVAKDALAEGWPIERSPLWIITIGVLFGFGGREEEVGRRRPKVLDDLAVAERAWLDDFAREEVGVDDGKVVWRGGEDRGDGGFSGGQAAG